MNVGNVVGFVEKALPWISAAASGNVPAIIALAAGAVSKITGTAVDPTGDAIHAAIANATPEQLLELKKADDEIRLKLQQLGFQSEKDLRALDVQEESVAASDRASARQMQINLRGWTVPILTWVVVVCAFTFDSFLVLFPKPQIDDVILGGLIGTVNAALMIVLNFNFGSSVQSHAQTRIMAQQSQTAAEHS